MEVLTREAMLQRFGGRRALDDAVAVGVWQRVLRGTYVAGGEPTDLRVRVTAAAQLLPVGR